ncbi:hypothetical protein Tco_0000488 [Tanacetum coccineum]
MARTRRSATNPILNNEGRVNQTALDQLVTQRVANALAAMEAELWNSKVKGTNIIAYTQCSQELALLCTEMPIDIHETITMAQSPMDQVVQDLGEKTVDNKRKWEGNNNNNNNNYNQNKRQEVARVYTAGPTDKGKYAGNLPHCSKCNRHHNGPCPPTSNNCGRVGHMAKDGRAPAREANQGNQNN